MTSLIKMKPTNLEVFYPATSKSAVLENKLVRKFDWRLMPVLIAMIVLKEV
jgi:hypothetical protein